MNDNESLLAFQRTLDNRYANCEAAFQSCLNAVAQTLSNQKVQEQVKSLYSQLELYRELLSETDCPDWLRKMMNATANLAKYGNANHAGSQFLEMYATTHKHMRPVSFVSGSPLVDFDKMYVQYRDEGNLPQLFDELIEILGRIIQSGEIEHLTTLQALTSLLKTLEANRDGSFLAVKNSFSVARYLKHLADVILEKVPVLSELSEAYDRTLSEAEREFQVVENKIAKETRAAILAEIPKLGVLSEYKDRANEIGDQPEALPAPEIEEISQSEGSLA